MHVSHLDFSFLWIAYYPLFIFILGSHFTVFICENCLYSLDINPLLVVSIENTFILYPTPFVILSMFME